LGSCAVPLLESYIKERPFFSSVTLMRTA
jgi:hypothetical protein